MKVMSLDENTLHIIFKTSALITYRFGYNFEETKKEKELIFCLFSSGFNAEEIVNYVFGEMG